MQAALDAEAPSMPHRPADMTAQNRVFFWGTTAIIVVYTVIIMFVNVRSNFPQPNNIAAYITRLSSALLHPTHGYPHFQVRIATTLRDLTTQWRVST
jgi:hypothetical protein